MKKVNKKGFVLAEAIVISVVVISALLIIYLQFSNIDNGYYRSLKYNNVDKLYLNNQLKKFIAENDFNAIYNDIDDETLYIDITNCSPYFVEYMYCKSLIGAMDANRVIITKNDTSELVRNIRSYDFSENMKDYIKNSRTEESGYRIIVEYNDNSVAGLPVLTNDDYLADFNLIVSTDNTKLQLIADTSDNSLSYTYEWYKNGVLVGGNKTYDVLTPGIYKARVINRMGFAEEKEINILDLQYKNDKNIFVAKQNDKCVLRRVGSTEIEKFNYNEKCTITTSLNMVKNGYLEYKDNTNFPDLVYNASEDALYTNTFMETGGTQYIPVDYNKTYRYSITAKSINQSEKYYFGLYESDVDKNLMYASTILHISNTLTYLTRDLKNGDTVVYLNDASNFINTTLDYQLGLIFWNYHDSTGYLYPELTYSRNFIFDLYTYGNINKTNNTITLNRPWQYGTYYAGTKLNQSSSGNSYNYGLLSNSPIPTNYTTYSKTITGCQNPSDGNTDKFRYGARYVQPLIFTNYLNNGTVDSVYIKDIIVEEI